MNLQTENKTVTYKNLNKDNLLNWVKFIIWVPLVVSMAILVTSVNYYKLEWAIGVSSIFFLLWIYRVSFSHQDNLIKIKYSFNLLGYYFLKIQTGEKTYTYSGRSKNFSVKIPNKINVTICANDLHEKGPKFKVN